MEFYLSGRSQTKASILRRRTLKYEYACAIILKKCYSLLLERVLIYALKDSNHCNYLILMFAQIMRIKMLWTSTLILTLAFYILLWVVFTNFLWLKILFAKFLIFWSRTCIHPSFLYSSWLVSLLWSYKLFYQNVLCEKVVIKS